MKAGIQSMGCANNLKQIGLGFRLWSIDNDDLFPFHVSTNKGGTKELVTGRPDDKIHFMVVAREIGIPKVLVCPADSTRTGVNDFASLSPTGITYEVRTGPSVSEANPEAILASCPIHEHKLRTDGSVEVSEKHLPPEMIQARKNTCINNLRQIDGAKQQWALENKKSNDALPVPSDLYGDTLYIKTEPECPSGGIYTIAVVGESPRCNKPGHELEPYITPEETTPPAPEPTEPEARPETAYLVEDFRDSTRSWAGYRLTQIKFTGQGVSQADRKVPAVLESAKLELKLPSNLVAFLWKQEPADSPLMNLEMTVSADGQTWSRWYPVQSSGETINPMYADGSPNPNHGYIPGPYISLGLGLVKFVKYRANFRPDLDLQPASVPPVLSGIRIYHLDSTLGEGKLIENSGEFPPELSK